MSKTFVTGALILGATLLGACSKPSEEPKEEQAPIAVAPPKAVQAVPSGNEAEKYFKTRCTVCHGTTGAGDGPGSAALDPKPRAFAEAAWQEGVTDEHLMKVITEGGVSVGMSPGMPAHPDLKQKPEVLKELVALIRGFKAE